MKAISKEQLESLNGKVILIKSNRYNGRYVDAQRDVSVTGCQNSKLLEATWTKFIVHHVEDNIVCFESLKFRDEYLDIYGGDKDEHDRHQIKLTKSNETPKNLDWARFSIWGENLTNVGIRSEKWTYRWLDACDDSRLRGTTYKSNERPTKPWGEFEIRFTASIDDGYVLVASNKNEASAGQDYTFTYSLGMQVNQSKSYSNSIQISVEAQKNFGTGNFASGSLTFGTKYSHEWASSSSETFESATQASIKVHVDPGKTVYVYQLQAKYGELEVGSNHTVVTDDVKNLKNLIIDDSIEQ